MHQVSEITKEDIPYVFRGSMIRINLVAMIFVILAWLIAAIVWSDLRPGIIELLVGLLMAPYPALFMAEAWIDYVTRAAIEARDNSLDMWIPLSPVGSVARYQIISRVVFTIGLFVSMAIVFGLWWIAPNIQYPLARFAEQDEFPAMSMGLAGATFLIFMTFFAARKTLLWYNALPSGHELDRNVE